MVSRRPYGTAAVLPARIPGIACRAIFASSLWEEGEAKADQHYGRIRVQLEKSGTPIGGNDLLIAAQVLAIDAVRVTDNVREFRRVKGLRVENWLRV